MFPPITFRINGIEAAVKKLEEAINSEIPPVMGRIAEIVRQEAQKTHRFQNHTYQLERSLKNGRGSGRVRNMFRSKVYSKLGYSGYVETMSQGKWAYLRPAFERSKRVALSMLAVGLNRAAVKAGWRRR